MYVIEFQQVDVTGWFSGTPGSVPAGFLGVPSHELIGMSLGGVINGKWSADRWFTYWKWWCWKWSCSEHYGEYPPVGQVLLLSDFRPRGIFRHRSSEQGARFLVQRAADGTIFVSQLIWAKKGAHHRNIIAQAREANENWQGEMVKVWIQNLFFSTNIWWIWCLEELWVDEALS